VINPATGSVVAQFNKAGEKEVNLAVAAARAAYKTGPWASSTGAQRAKCMLKFADLLEAKADEIAVLDPMSMGISMGLSKGTLIPSCVEAFRCEFDKL
jgi:aldehyde dehydrogenase (NAD+)